MEVRVLRSDVEFLHSRHEFFLLLSLLERFFEFGVPLLNVRIVEVRSLVGDGCLRLLSITSMLKVLL